MSSESPETDEELLGRIQRGNQQAFSTLVERHNERFYRLAYRYLQNREGAEDAVQDAFLKLWEDPNRWQAQHRTKFTTWFYRVVVNLCLDRQKKKKPLELDSETPAPEDTESIDESMIRAQEQDMLEKEISRLPERQQTALNLCFDQELTNQEAADVMGVNLKALQSLIMRAKSTLKDRMKSYL